MAQDNSRSNDRGGSGRDPYRDNDDARRSLEGAQRFGTDADTKSEARGDARENIENTARGTDAAPTGPDGNDKTKHPPRPDSFDADLNSVGG